MMLHYMTHMISMAIENVLQARITIFLIFFPEFLKLVLDM